MYMYVRHVITRRKPIAACAEIAHFLAICEEIAFFPCPNTAKIRHGRGRLEHVGNVVLLLFKYDCCSLLGHLILCRPVSTLGQVIPDIVSMGWSNMSICPDA